MGWSIYTDVTYSPDFVFYEFRTWSKYFFKSFVGINSPAAHPETESLRRMIRIARKRKKLVCRTEEHSLPTVMPLD